MIDDIERSLEVFFFVFVSFKNIYLRKIRKNRMKNFLIFVLVASLMGHSQALHLLRKRQVTVSPCTTGTCVNGGVCHTFGNVATCSCLPGYGGLFCELVINPNVTNPSISTAAPIPSLSNLCLPNPCLNGELMRSLAAVERIT